MEVGRSPFDGGCEDDLADSANDVTFLLFLSQLEEERLAVLAYFGDVQKDGGKEGLESFGRNDGRLGGPQRLDESLRERGTRQLVAGTLVDTRGALAQFR